jgi:hypothetical protein
MVTELRIYFEGTEKLKPGFHDFFKEIREATRSRRCRFALIATNGTPVQDFRDALKTHRNSWNVLLLDSDAPFDGSFTDLCRSKGLDPAQQDDIFWMVQIMEAWFLADVSALRNYYGSGFQEEALRGNPQVEMIPKADVLSRLKRATKGTTSGGYHKARHPPHLLATIDVARVVEAAPNCGRMFERLSSRLSED